jgi:hypothetical protein
MASEETVIAQLKEYCNEHGLDFEMLAEVLNEPKVVPMVRGIGYEYVVINYLSKLLFEDARFAAGKTIVNSQLTVKGSDAEIFDKQANKLIRLECKLAANGSFSMGTRVNNFPHCKIKIMRSRTLGEEMIRRVAENGVATIAELTAHKDSYLPDGFDFVITNLRNAFYITTAEDLFKFSPTEEQWDFLSTFANTSNRVEIDNFLKHTHFYIKATDLTPKYSHTACNRRGCPNPTTCNFIPNYPLFNMGSTRNWKELKNIRSDLL